MKRLKKRRVQAALEKLIAGDIDYDAHKGIKFGEEDDHEDGYPDLTKRFIQYYHEESK